MRTTLTGMQIALILALALFSCKGEKKEEAPPIVVDTAVRDAALLLGGVTPATNSALAPLAESGEYREWAAGIDSAWRQTQASNINIIGSWRKDNLTNDYPKTVFSPFSGPDILNAVVFFPHGTEYILYGLEPAGRVPRPENLDPRRLMLELRHLRNALGDILSLNFFQTLHMKEQVSEDSCSSFAGIIMFFLTRLNMEVVAARNLSIDTNGAIIDRYDPADAGLVPGVEFVFRAGMTNAKNPPELKTARYFSLDISDDGLAKKDNFERYVRALPECSTIIKAASFLMQKDFFSRVRSLVLDKSAWLLQDDSGVPLRFFLNDNWHVDYFGFYSRPIALFSNYFQRELLTNMQAKSSGPLPFSYGYDYKMGLSNLILAKKVRTEGKPGAK